MPEDKTLRPSDLLHIAFHTAETRISHPPSNIAALTMSEFMEEIKSTAIAVQAV